MSKICRVRKFAWHSSWLCEQTEKKMHCIERNASLPRIVYMKNSANAINIITSLRLPGPFVVKSGLETLYLDRWWDISPACHFGWGERSAKQPFKTSDCRTSTGRGGRNYGWGVVDYSLRRKQEEPMTSTKIMFLGILIMLLGFAIVSPTTQLVVIRTVSLDATTNLAYLASAVFVVGFIIGLIGFFRRS